MRKIKIVADSCADVLSLNGVDFAAAPLKIITDEREFSDDAELDVQEMVSYLDHYKGRSRSSCPNISDWLSAFGEADEVFCVTLTSKLSGSYNSAVSAKQIYESEGEGRRVFVIDSLSAGPEARLIVEKLAELVREDRGFNDICEQITEYTKKTGLFFMLKSLKNFANNGRVSPVLAKLVSVTGICIAGRASDEGTLEPTDKCRGEVRAISRLAELLADAGVNGGRVCISHCGNETGAERLRALIAEKCPSAEVSIFECRGLCSFYAERGGVLVGFERA